MTFHEQAALTDIFDQAYPPTEGIGEFYYYLGKLDGSIEITEKLESIPMRGVVTQVIK